MNLENHGEMFLEPSARMDIPSSDGCLLEWTNPSLDGQPENIMSLVPKGKGISGGIKTNWELE